MADKRVIVVTGANRGIGFAIVEELVRRFNENGDSNVVIYLTSRYAERGEAALANLEDGGNGLVKTHQLDVTDAASSERFAEHMRFDHGGVDVVIHNAGIAFGDDGTFPFGVQCAETMRVNYFGLIELGKLLNPLLRANGRVVIVTSRLCQRNWARLSDDKKATLLGAKKASDVTKVMKEMLHHAHVGRHEDEGFPSSAYGAVAIGRTLVAKCWHRRLSADRHRADIVVNAVCPGYVNTELTEGKGVLSPREGAQPIVDAALLKPFAKSPRGEYLCRDRICAISDEMKM